MNTTDPSMPQWQVAQAAVLRCIEEARTALATKSPRGTLSEIQKQSLAPFLFAEIWSLVPVHEQAWLESAIARLS